MKNIFFWEILKLFASAASGIGKRKKLFILIYHRVLDQSDFMRPGEVDILNFTWQMELISKYFHVLSLSDALQKMRDQNLPSRAVCITFDDGYADNYHNALPILKKFNLSAVFFIASGFLNGGRMWNDTIIEAIRNYEHPQLDVSDLGLGVLDLTDEYQKSQASLKILSKIKYLSPDQREEYTKYFANISKNIPDNLMMTDNQVKNLFESGMEIGGHTVNHPILAKLDGSEVEEEITKNKIYLENILGTKLRFFAYPNGKLNQDYFENQINYVKKAGYLAAVSTEPKVAEFQSDIWQLPRFTPWDTNRFKFMLRMISMYFSK